VTVTNPYYEFDPEFIPGTKVRSDAANLQFQALQNAFDFLPGTADAITTGTATFAPESGSGNAYVVTMPDTRTSEQDGDEVIFFATHTNSGAATLEVDGLGAKAIVRADGIATAANDLQSGVLYVARYDATNTRYQLVGPSTSYLTDATAQAAAAAASASAASTSETNAAASAVEAMQWAVHPEDDDVDSAPGQFSAFHWAQKALAAGTTGTITGDINTATPPTTEAITAILQYEDADNTDIIGRVGFVGSNEMRLQNFMHGGTVVIYAENAAGTPLAGFSFNPDTDTRIFHKAETRLITQDGGNLWIVSDDATAVPPTTETVTAAFSFVNVGLRAFLGEFGYFATNELEIANRMHGGAVSIRGENASGTEVAMVVADPDGPTITIGTTGAAVFQQAVGGATNTQLVMTGNATTDPTDASLYVGMGSGAGNIWASHDGASNGFRAYSDFTLSAANHTHEWHSYGTGASANQPLLEIEQDGFIHMLARIYTFNATEVTVPGITSEGTTRILTDTNAPAGPTGDVGIGALDFYDSDESHRLASIGFNGSANGNFRMRSDVHSGHVELTSQNSAGTEVFLWRGDPDAESAMYCSSFKTKRGTSIVLRIKPVLLTSAIRRAFSKSAYVLSLFCRMFCVSSA